MNSAGGRISTALAQAAAGGASAPQVAEAVAAMCLGIHAALAPILGSGGVKALFHRCLHLTARAQACLLVAVPEGGGAVDEVQALQAALAQQSGSAAALAGGQFLTNFEALLTSLIGQSLTQRLLDPVWATYLSGPAVQDNPR